MYQASRFSGTSWSKSVAPESAAANCPFSMSARKRITSDSMRDVGKSTAVAIAAIDSGAVGSVEHPRHLRDPTHPVVARTRHKLELPSSLAAELSRSESSYYAI